ncbi:hypothetical protein SS50377_26618 [Spironucleus salmonicida]|uniref:Uncharacterized protein n=1 Tax=Spironucleus salmonicida TaxID=348837 RepID=A0A9P8LQI7_9EUKA|nr:hypothetical protein SS50377_26618 [Spironucleus salmonicida]
MDAEQFALIMRDPRIYARMPQEDKNSFLKNEIPKMTDDQISVFYSLVIQPLEDVYGEETVFQQIQQSYPNIDEEIQKLK